MPFFPSAPPHTILHRQHEKTDKFQSQVLKAAMRKSLSPKTKRRIAAITGSGRCHPAMLWSDLALRKAASTILNDSLEHTYKDLIGDDVGMFHITFVDDIGLTTDREPELRVHALRRKIDKAIREMGLSAFVVIEIQPLVNYPAGGKGRTLMLHGQALCWGKVSRRKFQRAKKRINQSRSWSNMFGARPVKSRKLKRGLSDALQIASYISKVPADAKYRFPVRSRPGQFRFKPTVSGYPSNLKLRIIEGLSHYTIFEAVFAVNEGKFLRKAWKSELLEWQKTRLSKTKAIKEFDLHCFWRRFHGSKTTNLYKPFQIA
jgi:hypothetical protein